MLIKLSLFYRIVFNNYCDSNNLPFLANATAITPVNTTIVDTNYFNCNNGFQSSGGSVLPYYGCTAKNTTNGIWSSVSNYCNCIIIFSSLLVHLTIVGRILIFAFEYSAAKQFEYLNN